MLCQSLVRGFLAGRHALVDAAARMEAPRRRDVRSGLRSGARKRTSSRGSEASARRTRCARSARRWSAASARGDGEAHGGAAGLGLAGPHGNVATQLQEGGVECYAALRAAIGAEPTVDGLDPALRLADLRRRIDRKVSEKARAEAEERAGVGPADAFAEQTQDGADVPPTPASALSHRSTATRGTAARGRRRETSTGASSRRARRPCRSWRSARRSSRSWRWRAGAARCTAAPL